MNDRPQDAAAGAQHDLVATAREKFNCPACGGEAHWNPAKHALICPYCGTESPAELRTRDEHTVIVEHDLVAALRAIPDSARGWQAEKTSVQCQSCRAISVFDAANISRRCEFCGSTALVTSCASTCSAAGPTATRRHVRDDATCPAASRGDRKVGTDGAL